MKALFDQTKYTKWYIDKNGDVFTSSTYNREGKIRKVKPNINRARGYLYARTSNANYQIHRLVASAFIPNPENKEQVNHRDSDRHNNSVDNLEWVTAKENVAHAIKYGNVSFSKNSGRLKYTNEQCRAVIKLIKEGMTYKKAGEVHSMPYSTVAHLMRGSRREV